MAGPLSCIFGSALLAALPGAEMVADEAMQAPAPTPFQIVFPDLGPDDVIFQFRIDQGIVIRIPSTKRASNLQVMPSSSAIRWSETKAPKCHSLSSFAMTVGAHDDSLDIQLRDGTFIRAKFDDDCSADDFYSGFYVERPVDGQLCAGRDTLHSRSGSRCKIESFRSLRASR